MPVIYTLRRNSARGLTLYESTIVANGPALYNTRVPKRANLQLTAEQWRVRQRVARVANIASRIGPPTSCYLCGACLTRETAAVEHIIPIAKGGTNDPSNLAWACIVCNRMKGTLDLAVFLDHAQRIADHN